MSIATALDTFLTVAALDAFIYIYILKFNNHSRKMNLIHSASIPIHERESSIENWHKKNSEKSNSSFAITTKISNIQFHDRFFHFCSSQSLSMIITSIDSNRVFDWFHSRFVIPNRLLDSEIFEMSMPKPNQVAVRDLVEEAKKRIVILIVCVVGLSYLMSCEWNSLRFLFSLSFYFNWECLLCNLLLYVVCLVSIAFSWFW